MKKYVNKTNNLVRIKFKDGSCQFLMRGQSIETAKEVVFMSKGIEVKAKPAPKDTKQSSDE